jgi:two-component system chemotaxis sensor kinase CheA
MSGMGGMSGMSGMSGGQGGMNDRGQRKDLRTQFDPRRQPSMRMSIVRQYIVVTAVGNRKLGLVVDVVIGGQDVVIKALGPSLTDVKGFAGATELADQRLALVLDTPALIEEMHGGAGKAAALGEQRGNHG